MCITVGVAWATQYTNKCISNTLKSKYDDL